MKGITDSVAIVTGGSSGIGAATARRFGAEGATVVVADTNTEWGQATVDDIRADGGEAMFVETDVADPDAVAAMVEATVDEYGGLDYAVNNAGIEGENLPSPQQSFQDWQRVIDINLQGVFAGLHAEIPAILESDGGAIVNTASVAGITGFPGLAPYVASKHGVIGLTKTAAIEFGRENLRVNAVCPGVIDTPMVQRSQEDGEEALEGAIRATPLGRAGEPEEVGAAIVWLCSDDASYISGESLVIDGGLSAR